MVLFESETTGTASSKKKETEKKTQGNLGYNEKRYLFNQAEIKMFTETKYSVRLDWKA